MSTFRRNRKGTIHRLTSRGLSLAAIIALLATFIVPLGAGAVVPGNSVSIDNSTHPVSTAATITATLSNPTPANGTVVTFTISGPNSSESGTATTTAGVAQFVYTGGNPGTDTVNVSATGYPTTGINAYWSELTLTPDSQIVQKGSTVSIDANLINPNAADGGINNVPICFVVTGANPKPMSCTIDTNVSGDATLTYTATNTGADNVAAFADTFPSPPGGNGIQDTYEASATAQVTVADMSVDLSPSTQTQLTGANATLTATVTDQGNNEVEGVDVLFVVSGAHTKTATDTTDNDGEATLAYTESTGGIDNVRAFIDTNNNGDYDSGEPTDTATVNWNGYTLTLTPATQNAPIGTSASVSAHLTNSNSNVSDVPIRFLVSGPNAASAVTNTNVFGDTTFSFEGNTARVDTVTAYADLNNNNQRDTGEPLVTATVTWTDSITLTLTPSTQNTAKGGAVSVTAMVSNLEGPKSGAVVRYAITGANPSSGVVNTGVDGKATISYTGTNAGTDTINAYVDLDNDSTPDTGEPTASATVVVFGTATLVLSPAAQNASTNSSATITATVTSGNTSVAGVNVRYVISGVNASSGVATTNSSGIATITYTGTATGTDYVWAFVDLNNDGSLGTGEPATTVTVSWATGSVTPPPTNPNVPAAYNPVAPIAGCMYFTATQHNLCGDFAKYWNTYGGLAIFGFPITEPFQENGLTVQYTERGRFEAHPGTGDATFNTLLGLVGNEVTAGRSAEAPFKPAAAKNGPDCTYYAQTGHNLCAGFRAYWEKYGGLAIYGFPISEEFQEMNLDTGKVYTVQYFQRGRYEWHPGEWPERFDVELGRLGSQDFSMKYGTQYH